MKCLPLRSDLSLTSYVEFPSNKLDKYPQIFT